jgi:sporulation protein YlmC with PRC-barrel domain
MLQSIKQLYGMKLAASDGDIGHVKDFYFDDHKWAVRYVVADTGKWLPGRQVLLSPIAFATSLSAGKALAVKLTRKQVEDSPTTDTHKTVSRQYEEEYHGYYGWPYYWEGDGLWGGMRAFPILELPPNFPPATPAPGGPKPKSIDSDLRSTEAVTGYHIQATDGIFGHVCDFLIDGNSWAVSHLIVKTGHRFTGKEVQIPVSQVDRISYAESTVYVKLTKDAIEKSPEHRLIPNETATLVEPILIFET